MPGETRVHIPAPRSSDDAKLRELVARLSVDDKTRLLAGSDGRFTGEAIEIGLRRMTWTDGPAGVALRGGPEDFPLLTPCPAALAATWDRDLVRRVGEVVGDEALRRDIQVIHAPNVNLPRSPLGGRNFEQFSEDPWLTGILASEWMRGVQSRRVACAVKHFVCNDSETERQTMNARVGERVLREVYALPFQMAVESGAWGIMTAYNRVNGVYCSEHDLLRTLIKSDWAFDGFLMSDFHATHSTVPSIQAGLDVEMPGPPVHYGARLAAAVRSGEVSENYVDEAMVRFLRLAQRVQRLGSPPSTPPPPHKDPRAILKEAAAAGFVLLTNRNEALPLKPRPGLKIAVIGPNAAQPTYQGATFAQVGQRQNLQTPLDAIRALYGSTGSVVYEPGVMPAFRVPPLRYVDVSPASNPDASGMDVEYYVGDEVQPLVREVRSAGNLIWNLRMPGMGNIDRPGSVKVQAIFRPREAGAHVFHTGSSAAFVLRVAGQVVLSQGPQPALNDTAVAIRPEILSASCWLEAGSAVPIEINMSFGPSRAHSLHFGCEPPIPDDLLERAVLAAENADAVFLIVGETQDTSVESADRTTTRLPGRQEELIERVCSANPKTVLVLNASHPVHMPWSHRPVSILQVWYPGQEFAAALGSVLTGEIEPGGRLPVTFAADEADYPVFDLKPVNHDLVYEASPHIGYRHFDAFDVEPRFAFGHGLHFAEFEFKAVHLSLGEDGVRVAVTLRNTSQRPGKEVVQAYVRPSVAKSGKAPLELKGFATVRLGPGETARVDISLDRRAFAHWSDDGWLVEAGEYEILVGRSMSDIRFTDRVLLEGGTPGPRLEQGQ